MAARREEEAGPRQRKAKRGRAQYRQHGSAGRTWRAGDNRSRAGNRQCDLCRHWRPQRTSGYAQSAEPWSLTSLRVKLIKIGAKVVGHGRYVTFQMAEIRALRRRHRFNNQRLLDRRVSPSYFRLV
jgi:hypothetical protein